MTQAGSNESTGADKILDRAVVTSLRLFGEITGGQFALTAVVLKAFAAKALARTGFVSAVASV
jgi:hypothetical protein